MSVWVTRSAPDNLRTARGLRALGQKPLMVPVLTTVARYQPPITSLPDAILFTSVHAVRHFARHDQLSWVPVFVASGMVADAATAAGYATVVSTGGNEEALPELIAHVLPPAARILMLCGERTSSQLAERLRASGYRIDRQVVYKPVPVQNRALEHVTGALDPISAIIVHSRGGGERITPILREARWGGSLWCISQDAATACGDLRQVPMHIATQPTEASLLDMVARLTPGVPQARFQTDRSNADALISTMRSRSMPSRPKAWNDNARHPSPPEDDPGPTAA